MPEQIRIFRGPMEYINLLFPTILLALAIAEMMSGYVVFWSYSSLIKFVQDILFFNGLHICFTYILAFCTPAGRSATSQFIHEFGAKGLLRIGMVFSGSILIYFYFHQFVEPSSLWQIFFYLPLLMARRKHDLGQSKGLLRIANLQVQKRLTESNVISKFQLIQKWEHHILNIFYWTSTTAVFTFFYYKSTFGKIGQFIFWLTFCVSITLALAISACALMSPQGSRYWKLLFSARFFTKVLSPYSALVSFGGASVHGIEYICVTDKILRNQRRENKKFVWLSPPVISVLLMLTLIPYAMLHYPDFFLPSLVGENNDSTLYSAFVSVALGLTMTHYFLDHLLFTPKYKFAHPLLKALSEPEFSADDQESRLPKESA